MVIFNGKEAWRVLKPGGKIILGVLSNNSPWAKKYKKASPDSPYSHASFYTVSKIKDLLPQKKCDIKFGLHFGPESNPEEINKLLKQEKKGRKTNSTQGGFTCAHWKK